MTLVERLAQSIYIEKVGKLHKAEIPALVEAVEKSFEAAEFFVVFMKARGVKPDGRKAKDEL